jgi:hypothetical protein
MSQGTCSGVVEHGVEVVGLRNRVAHEGGVDLGSLPSTKPPRLGFGWQHAAGGLVG